MHREHSAPPHGPRTVPPFQVPFSFFGTALIGLLAAFVWMLIGAPSALGLLHLFVVGVFATVAMGALYQFVPVVGMVPLRWPGLAFVHLALAIAGTAGIVYGLNTGRFQYAALGGGCHVTGAVIQGFLLVASLWKSAVSFPARLSALALSWFVATAATGLAMAVQLTALSSPAKLVAIHPVLGLAGFYGTLITAVTFRLLKMFERINEEGRTPIRVAAVTAAVLAALFAGRAGAIALVLVAAVLMWDIVDIARRRNPAHQRETLWYSAASSLGALAAAFSVALGDSALAVALAVWFFIGAAVVGYLQRIVPFIWWIQRARRQGAKNIPTLKELNHSTLGYAILTFWLAGGFLWLFGMHRFAGFIGLIAWAGLMAQLSRPFVLQTTRVLSQIQ